MTTIARVIEIENSYIRGNSKFNVTLFSLNGYQFLRGFESRSQAILALPDATMVCETEAEFVALQNAMIEEMEEVAQ